MAVSAMLSHCRRRRVRPYGRTSTVPAAARSWIWPSRMKFVSAPTIRTYQLRETGHYDPKLVDIVIARVRHTKEI